MKRKRIERSGITSIYDPLARDMTLLDSNGTPLKTDFDQTLIQYPLRAVLEINSTCNFRCQYCSEGKNPPRFEIPKKRVLELVDEVEEMQIPELTFRGGEATLHPDFMEIWDYATKKDFTSTNLITNGFIFDIEKARILLENQRSKIIASLDGFPDINGLYRNPAQFNKVLSWLEPMLKEKPNQVTLLSVIYRRNYESLPAFARAMAEKGLEFFHLSPLKRLGRSEITQDNFVSYDEINTLQNKLEEITTDFTAFKPTVSCIALEKYKTNKTDHIPMPFFTEMHFGTGFKVTPQGNVMVNRGIMFTDRFKGQYTEKACLETLGSVYNKGIKQIWDETLDLRLKQGEIANAHYGYYLGWLSSLESESRKSQ